MWRSFFRWGLRCLGLGRDERRFAHHPAGNGEALVSAPIGEATLPNEPQPEIWKDARHREESMNSSQKAVETGEVLAMTGASNYLGVGLLKRLLDQPGISRVVAVDVNEPKIEHPKLIYHKVDLTSPASQQVLINLFQSEGVSTFVHLIVAYTVARNRLLAHELEAIGTMHVLDACSEARVRRIVARSTTAVYGAKRGNPNFLTEQHPVDEQAKDSFISDKIELERQMRQYARHHEECKVAILRDCTALGPTASNYMSNVLTSARAPRVLGYDPMMQFIHENDLMDAYEQVILNDVEGIYNIVGKGVVRYSEAVQRAGGQCLTAPDSILRATSSLLWNLKLYDVPSEYINHIKYPWVADGTKAALEFGFVPKYTCFEALNSLQQTRRNKAA